MEQLKKEFESVFVSTNAYLYSYIVKFVDNDEDAKDILQQCYIKLWSHFDTVNDHDTVLRLLYTYSRNMIIDASRRRAVEEKNKKEYHYFIGDAAADTVQDDYEVTEKIKVALTLIPERKRLIFLLRQQGGLSTKEIAERLNITQRSVRRHLEDAVSMLRHHLSSAELLALLVANVGSFSVFIE